MKYLQLKFTYLFLSILLLHWPVFALAQVCNLPIGYYLKDSDKIPRAYRASLDKIKNNSLKIYSIVNRERSNGSGVLLTPGNKIATTLHVVKNAIENNGLVYIEYLEKIIFLKLPPVEAIKEGKAKIILELETPLEGIGVAPFTGLVDIFTPIINSGYTYKGDNFLFSFGHIINQVDPYQKIYSATASGFHGMGGGGVFALDCKTGEVKLIGSSLAANINSRGRRLGVAADALGYSIYYDLMNQHNLFVERTLDIFCKEGRQQCSQNDVHFIMSDYLNYHAARFAKLTSIIELLLFRGHQNDFLDETQLTLQKGLSLLTMKRQNLQEASLKGESDRLLDRQIEQFFDQYTDFYKRQYALMTGLPPTLNLVTFYPELNINNMQQSVKENLLKNTVVALHGSMAALQDYFIRFRTLVDIIKSPSSWELQVDQLLIDKNQMRIDDFYNKYLFRAPEKFIY